jgi:beta-galactosidase
VFVRTPEVATDEATVRVTTTVVNGTEEARTVTLRNAVPGASARAESVTVDLPAESKRKIDQSMHVEDPSLWAPDSPHLYDLVSTVERDGQVTDYALVNVSADGMATVVYGSEPYDELARFIRTLDS